MMNEDHYLYLFSSSSEYAVMTLYVDGILIESSVVDFLKTIKGWLSCTFGMKDMRDASYILGFKIHQNKNEKLLAPS